MSSAELGSDAANSYSIFSVKGMGKNAGNGLSYANGFMALREQQYESMRCNSWATKSK